jgi:hypothetical protein
MIKITTGSNWWAGNDHIFLVTDIKIIDNKTWVFYKNQKTNQEYNCYADAFLNRFMEIPD